MVISCSHPIFLLHTVPVALKFLICRMMENQTKKAEEVGTWGRWRDRRKRWRQWECGGDVVRGRKRVCLCVCVSPEWTNCFHMHLSHNPGFLILELHLQGLKINRLSVLTDVCTAVVRADYSLDLRQSWPLQAGFFLSFSTNLVI